MLVNTVAVAFSSGLCASEASWLCFVAGIMYAAYLVQLVTRTPKSFGLSVRVFNIWNRALE